MTNFCQKALLSSVILLQLITATGCAEMQRAWQIFWGTRVEKDFKPDRQNDIADSNRRLLIIMIHGYNSTTKIAWGGFPDLIKREKDSTFKKFNLMRYGFGTSACNNNFDISDRGDDFASFLKDELYHYDGLLIIAHSMGGLVAMHALTALALDMNVSIEKVPIVLMTFGTPHLGVSGPEMLGPLGIFCKDPQAEGMKPFAKSLGDTRKTWDRFFSKHEGVNQGNTVLIRTYAGSDDTFVTPESACGRFPECERVDGNHAMMVKVDDDTHLTYKKVRGQIDYLEKIVDKPEKRVAVVPTSALERDHLQGLMDKLCDRGILRNPFEWEVPVAVHDSLSEIREEIGKVLKQIPTDSQARRPLQIMQQASREILQNPTVFPDGTNGPARRITPQIEAAITSLRETFARATHEIIQAYQLQGNCDLEQMVYNSEEKHLIPYNVRAVAANILNKLEQKKNAEVWESHVSNWLKERMTKAAFLANMTKIQFQLGGKGSYRELIHEHTGDFDPQTGYKGEFHSFLFATTFPGAKTYETIVLIREDNAYRMSGINYTPNSN